MTAPSVSIVVPVLNEAQRLPGLLDQLTAQLPDVELVVVDGGSSDGSPELVHPPVKLVQTAPGRGRQLNAGAAACSGQVLWFVHADTRPDVAALGQLHSALADPAVVGGGLHLAFDRRSWALRYVAWSSNVRARRLGWIFGDQAMFVRRDAFDRLGGFPEWPLMEDLELSRRLARTGRLVVLPTRSVASSRRFEEHGTWRLLVLMQRLKLAYFAGVDPAELARRYAPGASRRPRWIRRQRPSEDKAVELIG